MVTRDPARDDFEALLDDEHGGTRRDERVSSVQPSFLAEVERFRSQAARYPSPRGNAVCGVDREFRLGYSLKNLIGCFPSCLVLLDIIDLWADVEESASSSR